MTDTLILRVLAMYSFSRRVLFTLVTSAMVGVSLSTVRTRSSAICAADGKYKWCIIPDGPTPVLSSATTGCLSPISHLQCVQHSQKHDSDS
jgi:hypothetical protein